MNSRSRKKSPVWDFFVETDEGSKCIICHQTLSSKCELRASNLEKHLKLHLDRPEYQEFASAKAYWEKQKTKRNLAGQIAIEYERYFVDLV